jgi:hypothetical protein
MDALSKIPTMVVGLSLIESKGPNGFFTITKPLIKGSPSEWLEVKAGIITSEERKRYVKTDTSVELTENGKPVFTFKKEFDDFQSIQIDSNQLSYLIGLALTVKKCVA